MLITVTQEHIDKGRIRDAFNCPVSIALQEQFKVVTVAVNRITIDIGRFPDEVFAEDLPCPQVVKDWIANYDDFNRNRPARPFSFELNLTPPSQEESNVG